MTSTPPERTDLLFLCVANSARSQLAEGLARKLAPKSTTVHSAGSEPAQLHPLAVAVLAEVGIDISHHRSKGISEIPAERIARVITLCAEEVCPIFPGDVEILHWPTADPARVDPGDETDEAALVRFRSARDAIEIRLRKLFVDS
ncbi:MAG: arsenate reductase ArsC [Deltaproteobacteria bacterium]|nr:arsenate reductase ArsC [Deltaproteobacteria bacterium]MBW2722993.1 arsenate reductase ArsC [Deltaproteobacteria bacterium]